MWAKRHDDPFWKFTGQVIPDEVGELDLPTEQFLRLTPLDVVHMLKLRQVTDLSSYNEPFIRTTIYPLLEQLANCRYDTLRFFEWGGYTGTSQKGTGNTPNALLSAKEKLQRINGLLREILLCTDEKDLEPVAVLLRAGLQYVTALYKLK